MEKPFSGQVFLPGGAEILPEYKHQLWLIDARIWLILLKIVSFLNTHFSIDRSSWLLHLASFSHVFIVNGTDRTRKVLLLHFMPKVLFTLLLPAL